jgi:hypothetical protein
MAIRKLLQMKPKVMADLVYLDLALKEIQVLVDLHVSMVNQLETMWSNQEVVQRLSANSLLDSLMRRTVSGEMDILNKLVEYSTVINYNLFLLTVHSFHFIQAFEMGLLK